MNKICRKCGKKNVSDAQFCGGCGASLAEDEVSDLPVGTRWGRVCEIGRTYILKSLVLLVSVIVFISGFFTTVKYVPQETLHNDIFSYSVGSSVDMEDIASMFSQKGFDQNVFNVFLRSRSVMIWKRIPNKCRNSSSKWNRKQRTLFSNIKNASQNLRH